MNRLQVTRRTALIGSMSAASLLVLRPAAFATPTELAGAIAEFTGNQPVQRGRITLDLSPLVENGNSVSVSVKDDSPMTQQDHVTAIALFTEQNPQPNVIIARLGPRAGRAFLNTRMRLATSQKVVAVAGFSDGTFWSDQVEVIVTLAACVE
ncbi:MAG: SoxY-related AACIE arm protein [Ferrovibrio sp.]|uniref:SoxY-related AACIE arm protein n=1 Tax=Ferrovibrio sp. TaxID=1917215 RepID=UPI00260E51BD|nr:SoxY-related AACIE arm protein [Ferrovibrio sp.]MCW0232087.1 SoxY-related AACIE arm protein [Ferrovibrio sp.]